MNFRRSHIRPWLIVVLGCAVLICSWRAWGGNVEPDWTRSCPPNPYGADQPLLDLNIDGVPGNDVWDVPITLPKPGGGNYMTTDAAGNRVYLPAVPHARNTPPKADANMDGKVDGSAATLGGPDGQYSPRFVPKGDANAANQEGVKIGFCVYKNGRNKWTLCFDDVNMDGVPDKFTKSTWESEGSRKAEAFCSDNITACSPDSCGVANTPCAPVLRCQDNTTACTTGPDTCAVGNRPCRPLTFCLDGTTACTPDTCPVLIRPCTPTATPGRCLDGTTPCVPDTCAVGNRPCTGGFCLDRTTACTADTCAAGNTPCEPPQEPRKITTFTADLTKKKIVPTRIEQLASRGSGDLFVITDATIVDLGTDLSGVILNGEPIGLPDGELGTQQEPGEPSTCANSLTPVGQIVDPGTPIVAIGEITNLDDVSHEYNIALFGVNASGVTVSGPMPLFIPPGESRPYTVSGVVISDGPAALVAYAFAETGDSGDNWIDAAIFLSEPLPIPTVSEWGLIVMTLLLLAGAKVYFGRRRRAAA